jgi:hypothetical protein
LARSRRTSAARFGSSLRRRPNRRSIRIIRDKGTNARKRRGALLPNQAPNRAARADRYTERVEVLLLASDGNQPPRRPADDARQHARTLGCAGSTRRRQPRARAVAVPVRSSPVRPPSPAMPVSGLPSTITMPPVWIRRDGSPHPCCASSSSASVALTAAA